MSNANLRAFNKLRIRVEWKKFLFYDEFMTIFEIKKKTRHINKNVWNAVLKPVTGDMIWLFSVGPSTNNATSI